jgi:hypothetical protein
MARGRGGRATSLWSIDSISDLAFVRPTWISSYIEVEATDLAVVKRFHLVTTRHTWFEQYHQELTTDLATMASLLVPGLRSGAYERHPAEPLPS